MKYINDFLEYLTVIKKHSDNTINSYKIDLIEFYEINNNLLNVSEDDVFRYLKYLYDRDLNRNSISRKLSSIRTFYNYLVNNDLVKINYFSDISNPKKNKNLPHYLKDDEINKLFSIPDTSTALGQRNLLIIEMLYATGVRVSELVNIKLKDIDIYNDSIKIMGKGNKERIVFFGSFCKSALEIYLDEGRKELDKKGSIYLFLNKFGNKLSDRMIRNILDDLILKAGVEKHVHPHMIRHTFATDMLNSGADLMTVKELLGHESINTTSIYTHVSNEQIRRVYDNCHPRAKER